MSEIWRQPVFVVATLGAALGYAVMNLLMAATPLAMQVCGMSFDNIAWVLEWHVLGMFAPGFFTGHLIKRFGVLRIMGIGVLLNLVCIAVALNGEDLTHFTVALFVLGVGWNFLFTGSTTLSLEAYTPAEKDKAQGAINFFTFLLMALSSFASGALINTQSWAWLNIGAAVPVVITGAGLWWLSLQRVTKPRAA
jgi:MFS family permease